MLTCVDAARKAGASLSAIADQLNLSPRTLNRWRRQEQDRRCFRKFKPRNKLSEHQRRKILKVVNSQEYKDLPVERIVPSLLDKGIYLASESTFYRVLAENGMNTHRHATRPKKHRMLRSHRATGPKQVWTWDITYLPTVVRGRFLYLYLVCDIYSRKIVGWEIHEEECSKNAAALIRQAYIRERVAEKPLVLHSDNGSPMKGATMLVTLQRLGVVPSFSRPSVSNDNAFSEALFRTLKYRPTYPRGAFQSLKAARKWVADFVDWYNHEHFHSGIKFVTPAQRHEGRDREILANRDRVAKQAKAKFPERFTGATRDWSMKETVILNRQKIRAKATRKKKRRGVALAKSKRRINGRTSMVLGLTPGAPWAACRRSEAVVASCPLGF